MEIKTACEIVLSGDASQLQNVFLSVVERDGWKHIAGDDGWSGKITKGSKFWNAIGGALAQYHELLYDWSQDDDGQPVLNLKRTGTGIGGGLIGMSKVKKTFGRLVEELAATYEEDGHYKSHEGM